jgi:hypothetical protein
LLPIVDMLRCWLPDELSHVLSRLLAAPTKSPQWMVVDDDVLDRFAECLEQHGCAARVGGDGP